MAQTTFQCACCGKFYERQGNTARLYTFEGKTMCIADWAKEVGISPQSMQKRLNNGWPLDKAFSKERHDGKGGTHVKTK